MSDLISRADAIEALRGLFDMRKSRAKVIVECFGELLDALPSADAEPKRVLQGYCKGANCKWWNPQVKGCNRCVMIQDEYTHTSAAAVPQLKQTDTLIIADALRYLAQDTERHLTDRTRADALRQQFLKHGASMCKGGDDE